MDLEPDNALMQGEDVRPPAPERPQQWRTPPIGSSLEQVLKCNVYCTDAAHFATINAVYARYFPKNPPARGFICVNAWHGPFDVEIDCVAAA